MTPEMKNTLRILCDVELEQIREAHNCGVDWSDRVYIPELQVAPMASTSAVTLREWKHRVQSVRELIK